MRDSQKTAVHHRAVSAEDGETRLDRWFKRHFPEIPFGRLQKMLRKGEIRVDGGRAKADMRLSPGQKVRIPPYEEQKRAENVPVEKKTPISPEMRALLDSCRLYQDADVLVLNKPAGLAVQGGTNMTQHLDMLVAALVAEEAEKPRLAHRLDKETSGVLVFGLNAAATAHLTEAFRGKTTQKLYWALAVGVPKGRAQEGLVDLPLAKRPGRGGEKMEVDYERGKDAQSRWQCLAQAEGLAGEDLSWLALSPLTGRTHQLRVHCASLGLPILGDGKYGGAAAYLKDRRLARQLHLHARSLTFPHPKGGRLTVTATLPAHMETAFDLFQFQIPQAEPVSWA